MKEFEKLNRIGEGTYGIVCESCTLRRTLPCGSQGPQGGEESPGMAWGQALCRGWGGAPSPKPTSVVLGGSAVGPLARVCRAEAQGPSE